MVTVVVGAVILVAFLAGFLVMYGRRSPSLCRTTGDGTPLRVVTYNVGDSDDRRPTAHHVASILNEMPPADVYLLQEVPRARFVAILARLLTTEEPHSFDYRYSHRDHVAVLSRFAIAGEWLSSDHATMRDARSLGVIVDLPDGTQVQLVTVHLHAFWKPRDGSGRARIGPIYGALRIVREMFTPNGRSRAAQHLVTKLEADGRSMPTIVGGDFNTTPFTLAIRTMNAAFVDSLRGSGDFWTGSYTHITGPVSPRVDYLFHDGTWCVVDARVFPETAGDHLPLYGEYRLQKSRIGP